MSNIMGERIQVFVSGKTLACATTCSVNMSADEIDTSCKDTGGFNSTIPGRITWTINSDNLFMLDDYTKLVDCMINKTILDVSFATVANFDDMTEPDEDGHRVPASGWTSSDDMYYGKCTVSSIDLTADNGAIATYSVTFQGHGALVKSGTTTGTTTP